METAIVVPAGERGFIMRFSMQHEGREVSVILETGADGVLTARVGDQVYRVQAQMLGEGQWRVVLDDGAPQRVAVAAAGDRRFISMAGEHYTLTPPQARGSRKRAAAAGDLSAPMPGQVLAVLAAEGDRVTAGQTLVILEAMKMEIRVSAPFAGRVTRLRVAAGQVVERGAALVDVEPAAT